MGEVLGGDVVESGPPSRGWIVVVLAVVAAVVGAGLYVRTDADESALPQPSPSSPAQVTAEVTAEPSEPPLPSVSPSPEGTPRAPRLVRGPLYEGPFGPLLVVSGHRVFREAGGTTATLLDENVGGPSTTFARVRGGTMIVNGAGAGLRGPVVFLPVRSTRSEYLGDAERAAPALDDRTAWLQDGRSVRRVRVPGGRVVERRTVPEGTSLMSEVPGGLLVTSREEVVSYVVSDGAVARRLASRVTSAAPRHAVLVDYSCEPPCVQVADTTTWIVRTFHGYEIDRPPVLSPDGNTLAGYAVAVDGTTRLRAHDVTSATEIRVRGSEVDASTVATGAWSRDSATLYLALADERGETQALMWRRGSGSVAVLPGVAPWPEVWPE